MSESPSDIARANEIASRTGGRVYRHIHPESLLEWAARMREEDMQRLAVRMQLADTKPSTPARRVHSHAGTRMKAD